MPKRNRDRIMEQSMYDFLCMMNANLRSFNNSCIMIGLIGYDKKLSDAMSINASARSACSHG